MRIIGGEKKGFVLKSPRGAATRPTLARVRESLFGILASDVPGACVLDLFAGAGCLGLEALSRGARECLFVEKSPIALRVLAANVQKLGYEDRTRLVKADALRWLEMQKTSGWPKFSLVLADPPYDTGQSSACLAAIAIHLPMEPNATVAIQTSPREELAEETARLRRYRIADYGDTVVHFYVCTRTD